MEKELSRAARRAINDLELPCEVVNVRSIPGSTDWHIRFTPGYGQFSGSIHDDSGRRYSDYEITEILKTHLLSMEEVRVRHSER